jgi:hypothetical protein
MRRNVEAAGFGGDQGVFVVLCGGQRACRVELAEVISNTLSIYGSLPTFRRDSAAHGATDST